jgi:hypothetical protein
MKQLLFLFSGTIFLLFFSRCGTSEQKAEQVADSLKYEYKALILSADSCNIEDPRCTFFRYQYPAFSNLQGPLADSVSGIMKALFPGENEGTFISPDSSFRELMKGYKEYKAIPGTAEINWTYEINVSVIGQNHHWMQLEVSTRGFTGGAHDFANIHYHVLEKATGRKLKLNDFFDSTKLEKLRQMGEVEFCKVRNIAPSQSLSEAGFDFEDDRFFLPENFYFDQAGIHFIFNDYEVGPYIMRETEFFLPANKVVPLMKQPGKKK